MVAWCHLKSPKVWLSNKVNVREASPLEVGLLFANGNQSCFCLLHGWWAGQFLITEPRFWLRKRQRCTSPLIGKKKSNSSVPDLTWQVKCTGLASARFLYRMIWYLQLINSSFKQNRVVPVQRYETHRVRCCCLSGSYVCSMVLRVGRDTDEPTDNLAMALRRCNSCSWNFV